MRISKRIYQASFLLPLHRTREVMMSAAAHVAKKYMFAIATVYMCYLTHGVQAIILSQNKVNFYTQWGYTDAAAGAAAVSIAITLTGVGKFVSVWLGGEISDRIGRKIPAVTGSILYVICFALLLVTDILPRLFRWLPFRRCHLRFLGWSFISRRRRSKPEIRRFLNHWN